MAFGLKEFRDVCTRDRRLITSNGQMKVRVGRFKPNPNFIMLGVGNVDSANEVSAFTGVTVKKEAAIQIALALLEEAGVLVEEDF